jgi:preprotein translocase subunit YajC
LDPKKRRTEVLAFFIDDAWAQTGGGQGGQLNFLLVMAAMFAVFYFLLIRPQQKKQKEHRQMVEALGAGDEIVTAGGVLGRVTDVSEQFLTVEIANNVAVKVQRHTVLAVLPKGTVKSA